MDFTVTHYPKDPFCDEFNHVIDFLMDHGAVGLNKNWHWARWEWLLGHSMLDKETLPQIGIFKVEQKIVGVATHDMRPGQAYIICDPAYQQIKPDMLLYAEKALSHERMLSLFVDDNDKQLLDIVQANGYIMSDEKEYVMSIDCSGGKLPYELCDGYSITDFSKSKDLNKYGCVMWKGFNHEGLPPLVTEDDFITKPHENSELAVFVSSPNGEYAAHCGTWYNSNIKTAYVEPVVTIPECRKMGFGKAALYESINRCAAMGAENALVISNQQFYHRIGFKEYSVHSLWKKNII